jgi:hypothetical protein
MKTGNWEGARNAEGNFTTTQPTRKYPLKTCRPPETFLL